MEYLLAPGPAKKITIHLNEDTSSKSDYLSREILSLLLQRGVAGATVLRPEAGFGSHHRIHSQEGGVEGALGTAHHMPLRIEFIDTANVIDALLPALEELLTDGIIEAQNITILKVAMGRSR